MAVSQQKDQGFSDCSVPEVLGEVFESFQFSVFVGILKKQALTPEEECLRNRTDELAGKNENKQAKY